MELELDVVAGETRLGDTRRLAGRARETPVARAAAASPGHDDPRAGMSEIGEESAVRVEDLGADRHGEHDVLAVGAAAAAPLAVTAAPGGEAAPSL